MSLVTTTHGWGLRGVNATLAETCLLVTGSAAAINYQLNSASLYNFTREFAGPMAPADRTLILINDL